eukprot:TRINITY_DN920_c0_g2_i19.p1 TRINITY_DN920_c0_g2~~TRINITY_DN920_c0_g2_i19.p1  ORF type:complete len:118 (+),score=28.74 TRINITY_DN920_c0_g2_i19:194-547(+)
MEDDRDKGPEQNAEKTLDDLLAEKVKAQNRLFLKEKEFKFIERMDAKDLNKYLLSRETRTGDHISMSKPPDPQAERNKREILRPPTKKVLEISKEFLRKREEARRNMNFPINDERIS